MATSLDRDLVIADLRKTTWVWPQADDPKVINLEPFGTTGWYWGGSGHGKAVLKCGQQPWIRYEDVSVADTKGKDPDFWDGTGIPMVGQTVSLTHYPTGATYIVCGFSRHKTRVALENLESASVFWEECKALSPCLDNAQLIKVEEVRKALASYRGFLDTDNMGEELARHLVAHIFPKEKS